MKLIEEQKKSILGIHFVMFVIRLEKLANCLWNWEEPLPKNEINEEYDVNVK